MDEEGHCMYSLEHRVACACLHVIINAHMRIPASRVFQVPNHDSGNLHASELNTRCPSTMNHQAGELLMARIAIDACTARNGPQMRMVIGVHGRAKSSNEIKKFGPRL
jgi:hypothetical protein